MSVDERVKHADIKKQPTPKAGRWRLYNIEDDNADGSAKVKNKEGYSFSIPKEDHIKIGIVSEGPLLLTPTQMIETLENLNGFFHIRFFKEDGELREMYAHCNGRPRGNILRLVDLEKNATDIRQCHMDKVVSVVTSRGEHKVLQTAAFNALARNAQKTRIEKQELKEQRAAKRSKKSAEDD